MEIPMSQNPDNSGIETLTPETRNPDTDGTQILGKKGKGKAPSQPCARRRRMQEADRYLEGRSP